VEEHFRAVIDNGGKGIVLRHPKSLYESGRSASYLTYSVSTSSFEFVKN